MRRFAVLGRFTACLAALIFASCEDTTPRNDGIVGDGFIGACNLGTDKSVDWKSAITLEEGKEITGNVCPAKDQDFYKITVPQGKRLLRIQLKHTVETTAIQLTYVLYKENPGKDPMQVGTAPLWTASGIRTFDVYHCVDPATYYLVVKDEGDDNVDRTNSYKLTFSTDSDKDANEVNNDPASAKGPGTGTISCKGDLDYFKTSVAADQLLEVKLTTPGPVKVDLKYSIYAEDGKTKLGEEAVPDGMKAATSIGSLWALPKAGNYFVVVEDRTGNKSDPAGVYTLALTTKPELDGNEKPTRNDGPATATLLGSDTGTWTKTGQIGSRSDYDWYRVDGLAGVSPDNPAVIEVTLDFGGPSKIEPQIGLVYLDAATPCTKDACCRVLTSTCASEFDCLRQTYSCVRKEDIYCSDKDCAAQASPGCVTEQNCAGAVACVSGKCAAEQMSKQDDNGADGALIKTAQPLLHPGPWYIRVGDLKNDEYEYGKSYTLTVKVAMDPDGAKELNSEYLPIVVTSTIGTKDFHTKAAKKKNLVVASGQTVTGHISYEGDQDWYVFTHPCPGADCTYNVNFSASGCPSNVQFVYEIRKWDGDEWFAFPNSPAANQSGAIGPATGQCLYGLAKDGSSNYILTVSDYKHDAWSWSCTYSITLGAPTPGCNAPCKVVSGQCTQ